MQNGLAEDDLLDKRMVRGHGIYAKKGEWVTCENGHNIVQFACDVPYGGMFDQCVFENWQQTEPKYGELIHPCDKCGQHFFAGMQFHFPDGWRV